MEGRRNYFVQIEASTRVLLQSSSGSPAVVVRLAANGLYWTGLKPAPSGLVSRE